MPRKGFYIGCPNCRSDTGAVVSVNVTVSKYGAGSQVAFKCPVCGEVEEIDVNNISLHDFITLIQTNNQEDKNAG